MSKQFEVKVKYIRESEDGSLKKVTEQYLVDAVTVSDAETKMTEFMEGRSRGEFIVVSVKEVSYAEVVIGDADHYYQSDIETLLTDADTGKESSSKQLCLINAENIDEAFTQTKELYKDTMYPYQINGVKRTKILEVVKD